MKSIKLLLCLLAMLCPLIGQSQSKLKVATRVVEPFVMQDGSRLKGFSVDLWKAITDKMGVQSEFVMEPTVVGLLDAVKTHKAEVGISAISISAERDKDFDFSQPMFDSGLQIMVRDQQSGSEVGQIWDRIVASGIFRWLAVIFVIGIIPAHIVWLVEHRSDRCLLQHKKYWPGIFEAYWWSLSCLATQAEEMPKSGWGRAVAVFWMFTAVVFIAFFTAQVTASVTVEQLHGSISSADDLPGKKVATTSGSTAATYLREHHAKVTEVSTIDAAADSLENGDVDAVVFDAPVLQYFVANQGKNRFRTVGEIFQKEYYGIVFMPNSPYRKPIETALLSLKEDGTYQEIYDKWFSSKS
ncbi:MAG TPA: transporter substrate-binding domain-containing protein, partial [Fimbriimonas sp.]|nr:transporter substrate-binding domain-containing protein [Fimbriimonas sp.]